MCASPLARAAATGVSPMNRYAAPLGFTLAAIWVVVLFVLVSSTT
ncbi:MAG TPA: hypothetical protein VF755_19730 [Catenuloplanes sp.]